MLPRRSSRGRSRLYRIYRYVYLKLVRENDSPERVGRGAALGIFIGVFPTLWFGPVLAWSGAGLIAANRASALVIMIATGPLIPFIWTLCVLLGNALVSPERRIAAELIERHDTQTVLQYSFTTFMLGNILVSFGMAAAAYVIVWMFARRFRRRKLSAAGLAESAPEAQ
jgi:uncharacterized protein (DUF2062 family)